MLRRKYDETLDALQSDIDTLEDEKAELKKRLVAQSKQRNVLTDLAFKSPAIGAAVPGAGSEIASILASSTAGPLLLFKDVTIFLYFIRVHYSAVICQMSLVFSHNSADMCFSVNMWMKGLIAL